MKAFALTLGLRSGPDVVARRGLAYDLLVKGPQVEYVPHLAEKVPNLRMVVDHIAKPPIAAGVTEPWATVKPNRRNP